MDRKHLKRALTITITPQRVLRIDYVFVIKDETEENDDCESDQDHIYYTTTFIIDQ